MKTTERAKLRATFHAKKAAGLKDMKFFLTNPTESTVEDICAEVNHWYQEVEAGNATQVVSWGDADRTRAAA